MNIQLPIICSPSRLETAARCARKHVLSNVACLAPIGHAPGTALAFGTAVHAAAAVWWREQNASRALEAALTAFAESGADWNRTHSEELLRLVVERYCKDALLAGPVFADQSRFTPVALEERVVIDTDPTYRLSFQLDRLVVDKADASVGVLVDTKTASRMNAQWHRQWPLSLQQKLYAHMVRKHYGVRLIGHFIEGVGKQVPIGLEYVQLPDWSDDVLDEAVQQLIRRAQADAGLVASCLEPETGLNVEAFLHQAATTTDSNPAECWSYNSPCVFLDVCTAEPAMRASLLADGYEVYEAEWLG